MVDYNGHRLDRLYLLVEDEGGRSRDVCMAVTVYNRQCPLKDSPQSAATAQMFAIGLSNVALQIRTDKFHFNDPFYVSIMVLPSNRSDDNPKSS